MSSSICILRRPTLRCELSKFLWACPVGRRGIPGASSLPGRIASGSVLQSSRKLVCPADESAGFAMTPSKTNSKVTRYRGITSIAPSPPLWYRPPLLLASRGKERIHGLGHFGHVGDHRL